MVLNDSLTGNDLVFDSNSKKNRVHSVENYKKDGKWYTDITVVLKASTDYIQRTIEVKEVNFLRQVINKSIQADLNHSYSKTIEVEVSQSFVPNSIYFYEYKEVQIEEKTGIEITKLIGDYGYPKTVYFPEYIDGLPVISIGINIVPIDDNLHFSNCVVPESVSYFHGRLLNENVGWIDEKVIILRIKKSIIFRMEHLRRRPGFLYFPRTTDF